MSKYVNYHREDHLRKLFLQKLSYIEITCSITDDKNFFQTELWLLPDDSLFFGFFGFSHHLFNDQALLMNQWTMTSSPEN
jgi:hypothetical protein